MATIRRQHTDRDKPNWQPIPEHQRTMEPNENRQRKSRNNLLCSGAGSQSDNSGFRTFHAANRTTTMANTQPPRNSSRKQMERRNRAG